MWRGGIKAAWLVFLDIMASRVPSVTLKPTIVLDYNVRMGGVECKYQQISMYSIERTRIRVYDKKVV